MDRSDLPTPSIPARCHFCTHLISVIDDHDISKHPADEPLATQYQKGTRSIKMVNYVRVGDEQVEYASVAVLESGNVEISAAHYNSIMVEAGWKRR